MPRQKRPLAEVDANISKASEPAKKKSSTGSTSAEKENSNAPNYGSKTLAELRKILKERSMPHSGTKSELVDRLDISDGRKAPDNKIRAGAIFDPTSPSGIRDLEFITLCRPPNDISDEKWSKKHEQQNDDGKAEDEELSQSGEEDKSDEDEDEDEYVEILCGTNACMCRKEPAEHPEWKWVITRKGLEVLFHLQEEADKRDQDIMGEDEDNDFTGYGFQEVVQNHLKAIDKELKKKNPDIGKLWPLVEAFAHFLPGDTPQWFWIDDGEQLEDTLRMIGIAVICTLKVLDKHDLLKANSTILDIPLVFGLFYNLNEAFPGGRDSDCLLWVHVMVSEARKQGIELRDAPYAIEESVSRSNQPEDEVESWKFLEWKPEFIAYKQRHTTSSKRLKIGGDHYDLSKGVFITRANRALDGDYDNDLRFAGY